MLLCIKPRRFLSPQPMMSASTRHQQQKITLWVHSDRAQAQLGIFSCNLVVKSMKRKAIGVQKPYDPDISIKNLHSEDQQAAYMNIQSRFALKEGNIEQYLSLT